MIETEKNSAMMRWGYLRKGVVCMMLGSFLGLSTACFGPFNLTKSVYHWNSGIEDRRERHSSRSQLPSSQTMDFRSIVGTGGRSQALIIAGHGWISYYGGVDGPENFWARTISSVKCMTEGY